MSDTKELRRLLAEATPGEWQSFIGGNFVDIWAAKHSYATVGLPSEFKVGETNYRQSNDGSNTRGKAVANAALIVALRNAASELLDRLERAEQIIEQYPPMVRRILGGKPVTNVSELEAEAMAFLAQKETT